MFRITFSFYSVCQSATLLLITLRYPCCDCLQNR